MFLKHAGIYELKNEYATLSNFKRLFFRAFLVNRFSTQFDTFFGNQLLSIQSLKIVLIETITSCTYKKKMECSVTLRKNCSCSELFWSAFSRIRTRVTPNTDTFYAVECQVRVEKEDLRFRNKESKLFNRMRSNVSYLFLQNLFF